jgi:hypothetical protein
MYDFSKVGFNYFYVVDNYTTPLHVEKREKLTFKTYWTYFKDYLYAGFTSETRIWPIVDLLKELEPQYSKKHLRRLIKQKNVFKVVLGLEDVIGLSKKRVYIYEGLPFLKQQYENAKFTIKYYLEQFKGVL